MFKNRICKSYWDIFSEDRRKDFRRWVGAAQALDDACEALGCYATDPRVEDTKKAYDAACEALPALYRAHYVEPAPCMVERWSLEELDKLLQGTAAMFLTQARSEGIINGHAAAVLRRGGTWRWPMDATSPILWWINRLLLKSPEIDAFRSFIKG